MGKLAAGDQGAARRRCATTRRFEEAHHLLGLVYLDRHWHKKALEAFRQAQLLNPKKMQYQDLVRYLSGHAGFPLPEVRGEAKDLLRRAEELVGARQPQARAAALPAGPDARAREPDAADVLRPALPAPRPPPGDRGGDPQGAGPESRRDAARHRLRHADRGAAQPRASTARATGSASEMLGRGRVRTSPRPSPLRDGLQPGRAGGGPRPGAGVRAPVARARPRGAQAVPARRPRLGALQAARVRAGDRLPVAGQRARALASRR